MATAPPPDGPAPAGRRVSAPARGRRLGGVSLTVAVAALVWFVVPAGSSADPGPTDGRSEPTATTTAPAEPVTVYGCPIAVPAGSPASAPAVADADCTDASVVAEYCNVPRASIATPGLEERTADAVIRTYETVAGLPAGAVTHHVRGTGPADVPVTLACASKRTFAFTAADVDAFTRPA